LITFNQAEIKKRATLFTGALALACISLSGLKFYSAFGLCLFMVGIVGGMAMIFITGPHGGGTHEQNVAGGIVFVIVNTVVFYFLIKLSLRLFRRKN